MKKLLLFTVFTLALMFTAQSAFGEIVSRVLSYNGPGNQLDKCNGIVQDNTGKVYATGVSWGGNNTKEDYATIKFGEDGDFLWVVRYDGPGHNLDNASAIAIDNYGNVYVTGWSRTSTDYGSEDYLTIKYNPNGVQLWAARYDGAVAADCYYYDYAKAICIDAAGNVYVTGESWGNDELNGDYLTVKYNSNGVLQWAKRYNGPSSKEDFASSLCLDPSGNIIVTGKSFMANKGFDMLSVKYNSGGTQQWTARYNGPNNSDDAACEVRADRNSNVYITGSSHGGASKLDYTTVKYNSAGVQSWASRYNGSGNDTDAATGLDLDIYGNVYVAGYTKGVAAANYDFTTIKYNPGDGSIMWNQKYDGGSVDKAWDIKVVYKPCNPGTQLPGLYIPCWVIDVYVTGQSTRPATTNMDMQTIRYDEYGAALWSNRFNGPTNGNDAAYSISVHNNYPVMYAAGSFANDYGIIGITEVVSGGDNFGGSSTMSYPNPFNPETKISFKVEKETNVKLVIFDMLGRTVATLVDGKVGIGTHTVSWNASGLNSGVYFYRYETGYSSETKKLVLIK